MVNSNTEQGKVSPIKAWEHWQVVNKDTCCVKGIYHGKQEDAQTQYPNNIIMIDNRNDSHPFWKQYHSTNKAKLKS